MSFDEEWVKSYEEWKKVLEDHAALVPPPPPTAEPRPCFIHVPVRYEGFTEVYEYCSVCDYKRKDGKTWVK